MPISSLAIIPARSGSQGIPNKNIQLFAGKPLIVHTILQAQQSQLFDYIMVSTNVPAYADIAREYGAEVPFLRPDTLSTSHIPTSDVVVQVLLSLSNMGKTFDSFAVLQPTSPLRTVADIRLSYNILQGKNADAVISVCEAYHPPEWNNTLRDDASMINFIPKHIRNKPRQLLPKQYTIHGAIFWATTAAYDQNQDPYTMNSFAYVMPRTRSVDIDSMIDFHLAELLFEKNSNLDNNSQEVT